MREIIEKTKELGALIQSSEEVRRFTAARDAYNKDEDIQKLVLEFNRQKMTMMSLSKADQPDETRIAEAETRIKNLYDSIMASEKMKEFQESSNKVQELLNQVNGIINFYVTGEEPAACTHDCSTCGGCH